MRQRCYIVTIFLVKLYAAVRNCNVKFVAHGRVRTRAFEGKFEDNDFVAHDGDRREISQSDIYKLGEVWQCNDKVWAYWTKDNKYLNSGKVIAVGAETLKLHLRFGLGTLLTC